MNKGCKKRGQTRVLHGSSVLFGALLVLLGCGGVREPKIENLQNQERVMDYSLTTFEGERDGDRLAARIVFSGSGGQLVMNLQFRVGVPTRLETGRYRWQKAGPTLEGDVSARSVTFLGGQSDRPGLGGVFELLSSSGQPIYRVEIPTSQLDSLASVL